MKRPRYKLPNYIHGYYSCSRNYGSASAQRFFSFKVDFFRFQSQTGLLNYRLSFTCLMIVLNQRVAKNLSVEIHLNH